MKRIILNILTLTLMTSLSYAQKKIYGGSNANIKDVPWQVSIFKDGKHNCGGSIISNIYVLTAAHCLKNIAKSRITVYAGITKKSNKNSGQKRSVSNYTIHSSYSFPNNDIAIIKLSSALSLNNCIRKTQFKLS